MKLEAHGLAVDLPDGWEGGIRIESRVPAAGDVGSSAAAPPETYPTAHFSTAPLPPTRGDFGAEVAELLRRDDAFVALLEYDPAETASALFAGHGLPRRLDPRRFSPSNLQRTGGGRVGYQDFFQTAGRAFCLYVVLGSGDDVHRQTRRVEALLGRVRIEPGR